MTFSKMIFLRNQGKIYKIGIDGLDTDESSVNHFGLIANLFLELREKYSLSTSATCFQWKLGHVVEQDRNMFANEILNVLHKDGNLFQRYELRMTVYMGKSICKSLPKIYRSEAFTYINQKSVLWNEKNCKWALILRLER